LVEQVQQLHQSGVKQCEIARQLNLATWNVSRWCRKLTPLDILTTGSTQQEKDRYHWYKFDKINFHQVNQNSAKILLALLYWCEGCKYPGTNKIEFVCSDEKMQATFIKLMRIAFDGELNETKFRVMLQLHTTHNINKQIAYWSKLLNIPKAQFIKPHLTVKKNSRYRPTYNGTCNLRYFDYKLVLRIMGIYNQISQKIIQQLV